jgi:hypothetical protein
MTQDEIIEMARKAGLEVDGVYFSDHMYRAVLVRFAKLVATKERAQPPRRTWVGLTDEEIEYVWRKVETSDFHDCVILFAKELEAKLKEKNSA